MRLLRTILLTALAFVALYPARPLAWGPEGHRLVARIAWSRMTDAAKQAALAILGSEDFVTVSNWADTVRSQRPETYNWHFVDIPYGASAYDAARDCAPSPKGDCIIAALVRNERTLHDSTQPRDARSEALKFVIHFVGDLHQPLHAIDNHDKGGNDVRIEVGGRRLTNLHAIWDSGILNTVPDREDPYADTLIAAAKALPASVEAGDYSAWALESHALAVKAAYTYPGFEPGAPPKLTVKVDESYLTKNRALVEHQLEVAGIRLATVLNRALGR